MSPKILPAVVVAIVVVFSSPSAWGRQDPLPFDNDLTDPWWAVEDGTCPALTVEGWSSLPGDPGTDSPVYALDSSGPYVFAGGGFGLAGGKAVSSVARWNGSAWSALTGPAGNGVSGTVYAVGAYGKINGTDTDVLVGGAFGDAAGVVVSNMAFWSEANGWSTAFHAWPEEIGPNGIVSAFSDPDAALDSVYVGGSFDSDLLLSGQQDAHENSGFTFSDHPNVAWWDLLGGAHFWPLTVGPLDGPVYALRHFDDGGGEDLYVGGGFLGGGSGTVNRVARVGAAGYEALDDGFDNAVLSLAVFDGPFADPKLFAAGVFQNSGATPVSHIARWNGSTWTDLDGGTNSTVYSILSADIGDGSKLYATGAFTDAGGLNANLVARWTGSQWKRMGRGLAGPLLASGFALTEAEEEGTDGCVYVGGNFDEADGLVADNVARWCCQRRFLFGEPRTLIPRLNTTELDVVDRNGDGLPEEVECGGAPTILAQDSSVVVCGRCLVVGTAGPDVLAAPAGCSSLVFGGSGDDTIVGSDQDDVLFGGEGSDQISAGAGRDRLFGDGGSDTLRGGEGDDAVGGGDGNDDLDGGADGQSLPSGPGRDLLVGGAGSDGAIVRSAAVLREIETERCAGFPVDPGCVDQCPGDSNKILAGACGCGVLESDTDEDGSADCNDGCPLDKHKTASGACGCGALDTDVDGDGLPGCIDNCRGMANPGQADADSDGIGDSCDQDADNDFIVDSDDTCPNASSIDRDLDHNGCRDTKSTLAALLRLLINDLEADAAGDPDVLTLLRPGLRRIELAAQALDEAKAGIAIRNLRGAVKSLLRAVSRGLALEDHALRELAAVVRVLALLEIDAAEAAPGADPLRLAAAQSAYDAGVVQLGEGLYAEAAGAFRDAARSAMRSYSGAGA